MFCGWFLLFTLTECRKKVLFNNPTLDKLEKVIREKYDSYAEFSFEEYEAILQELTDPRYTVLSVDEFQDSLDSGKVMIAMRHDVDAHPFKAMEMAVLEEQYGIKSTFYMLATAYYSGKFKNKEFKRFECMEKVYQELSKGGHEIGIHNDLLTVMIDKKMNPYDFNKEELSFYSRLGISVVGSAAHGSGIARETVPNYEIFSDFAQSETISYLGEEYEIGKYSLAEFGYSYEAYHVNDLHYYSESGAEWNVGSTENLINVLKQSNVGDRIQILTHPVWWGK